MVFRWTAFAVWFAVAASALTWGLRFFTALQVPPPPAANPLPAMASAGDLTRLLGVDPVPQPAGPAPVPASSLRVQLIGVISTGTTSDGDAVALIQVNDKPARAYRPGETVDAGAVLQEVRPRSAAIGPRGGPAMFDLTLAALPLAGAANASGAETARALPLARPPISRPTTPPPMPAADSPVNVAPNVLLNNPADMAPAHAGNSSPSPGR